MPHAPRPCSEDLFPGGVAVIAHRGASAVAPENTLAAFRVAVDLGAGIELDVGLCASGEPVVIHDDAVDRTTDGTGSVADLPLAALQELDAGAWFSPEHAGERIPTLAQVLEQVDGRVPLDIELKSTSMRRPLVEAVVGLIERHALGEKVVVTSFDPYLLAAVRRRNGWIRRGQIYGNYDGSHLPPFRRFALQNLVGNPLAVPDVLAVHHAQLTPAYVERMRARGYRIVAWTVNDRPTLERLVRLNIDAIITDKPDLLLEVRAGARRF
jgi:glycerophosphoryl diester phosphodiesterase